MKRKPPRRRLGGPFGARIKALRDALDMSQDDLAALADVHFTAVSHWENGRALPVEKKLPAIARALKTNVGVLIEGVREFEALSEMLEAAAS